MIILSTTINARVYIGILDNFLINSPENLFRDTEVIFQDTMSYLNKKRKNISLQHQKKKKQVRLELFLQENKI